MQDFPVGPSVHATAVVVGEACLVFTGASGSGKTVTALRCLASARARGWFAALVGDDAVRFETCGGRVVVHAVPAIAGLAEIRGTGIVAAPHRAAACLSLVVAPGGPSGADRLPPHPETAAIGGVEVPLARFFYDSPLDPLEVLQPFGLFASIRNP